MSIAGVLMLLWSLDPVFALSFGPLKVYLQYWVALVPLPAIFLRPGAFVVPDVSLNPFQKVFARTKF